MTGMTPTAYRKKQMSAGAGKWQMQLRAEQEAVICILHKKKAGFLLDGASFLFISTKNSN